MYLHSISRIFLLEMMAVAVRGRQEMRKAIWLLIQISQEPRFMHSHLFSKAYATGQHLHLKIVLVCKID